MIQQKMFNMKRIVSMAIVAVMSATALAWVVRAQEEKVDPRILAYDKGASKIDVSKYPPEIKGTYKLATTKCAKCHTIARAINCDFALPDEWERYTKRMMRRAGAFISPDEGKKLYDFWVYDSKTRKKALYDRKMQEGPK